MLDNKYSFDLHFLKKTQFSRQLLEDILKKIMIYYYFNLGRQLIHFRLTMTRY